MSDPQLQLRAAFEAHRRGELAQAERMYRDLLASTPGHAVASRLLGTLLAASGRHREGIALLRKAVASGGPDAEALSSLGAALLEEGNLAEAVTTLINALALAPGHVHANYNLGSAFLAQGRNEDAARRFQQARERNPAWIEAIVQFGNARKAAGRYQEAAEAYQEGLRLRPNDGEIWNLLGFAQRELRQFAEAEASYRRAIELRPSCIAMYGLGDVYKAANRDDVAHAWYLKAIEADPRSSVAHLRLTFSLLATGAPEKLDLQKKVRANHVYADPDEARVIARNLASHFCYPDDAAASRLADFFDRFHPGEIYPAAWWREALSVFGTRESGYDKIVRAVMTAVYSWSAPSQEALEQMAAWIGGRTLASFGAGAAYWEYLLSRHFGVHARASDIWLRHRFLDVLQENHTTAKIEPEWVVMFAWIPFRDESPMRVLDRMSPGQKLIVLGEPADAAGRATLCATESFFDRLRTDFEPVGTHTPVRFSYVFDTLDCYVRR